MSENKQNQDQGAQVQRETQLDVQQNHPLHGVGLETMLGELVRQYGWPVLAEQIPIKCFQSYPTFNSCKKFLKKTPWARERLEAFYLYKYKSLPRPTDAQYALPPRERIVEVALIGEPTDIALGESEFFDDPASGPSFPTKKAVEATRARSANDNPDAAKTKIDPWEKWK